MAPTSSASGQPSQPCAPPPPQGQGGEKLQRPPHWLMGVLALCLALVLIGAAVRSFRPGDPPEAGAVAAEETAGPTPEAEKPSGVPSRPPAQPSESQEPVDSDTWFSDAVFIGDSRVDGLHIYSGITAEATFLDHTGLTVYEVKEGKEVIRRGDKKVSVLDALAGGTYGKVYLALGINELGYFDPEGFAETTGEVVELIREELPDARIYIQSLIPVNTDKCKANDIPYYITNEGIAAYNEALKTYFAHKDVYLLGIPEGLTDESGEMLRDYSADGVHLKKDGYVLWLDYLSGHREG